MVTAAETARRLLRAALDHAQAEFDQPDGVDDLQYLVERLMKAMTLAEEILTPTPEGVTTMDQLTDLAADVTVVCDAIAYMGGLGATRADLEAVNGVAYEMGTRFGRALDEAIRRGLVLCAAGDHYILTAPDATPADQAAAIARTAAELRSAAGRADGLTLRDVVRRARIRARATEYRLRAARLDGHTHGLYHGGRLLATYPSAEAAQPDLEVERGDAVAEQRDPKAYRIEPLDL